MNPPNQAVQPTRLRFSRCAQVSWWCRRAADLCVGAHTSNGIGFRSALKLFSSSDSSGFMFMILPLRIERHLGIEYLLNIVLCMKACKVIQYANQSIDLLHHGHRVLRQLVIHQVLPLTLKALAKF